MRDVIPKTTFKKDYKRLIHSGYYDIKLLQEVPAKLANEGFLEEKYRDHALECRECHLKPDWLLIYQLKENELILIRTGSHSDLF